MKKIWFGFLFIMAAVSVCAQNGVIRELSGTVELKKSGDSSFSPARAGDELRGDTVISTGFKSSALIAVGSSFITVRPLTRLTLAEIRSSQDADTLNVNLQTGRVRVDVNPPAGRRAVTTVSSPLATASVRGTSFEFDTRNIWVSHGKVSFYGKRGQAMLIGRGSQGKLDDGGKAVDPVLVKMSDLLPPPPAGSDYTGGAAGGKSPASSAAIAIELVWLQPK